MNLLTLFCCGLIGLRIAHVYRPSCFELDFSTKSGKEFFMNDQDFIGAGP